MKLTTRHVDDALIIDLIGDWPEPGEGQQQLGQPLRRALEGHSGRVILNISHVEVKTSIHVGIIGGLIATCLDAGIPRYALSFVATDDRRRVILNIGHGPPGYSTEEEAMRKTPLDDTPTIWSNITVGVVMVLAVIALVVGFTIKVLWYPFGRLRSLATRG